MHIWNYPIYLPYLQPELTDDAVKDAEARIGYKLPEAYIKILKEQNGGYIRYSYPDYDLSQHSIICGIGPYYPNIVDERAPLTDYEGLVSFETKGLLPFDGDGHWYICMDYRQNQEEPEITYIELEQEIQKKVARTFTEYLSKLGYCEYEELGSGDFGYVIETHLPIQEVIKAIEDAVNIKFEYLGDDGSSDTYRGKIGSTWIFIEPNKVKKAFIRTTDDRYEELKHLIGGTALCYPEIPEDAITFSAIDETVEEYLVNILSKEFTIKHAREYLDITVVT